MDKESLIKYVVIDTNVLVSAMLKWDSVPGRVLRYVFDGELIPVFNEEILKEYREVLLRKKFHFPEEAVNTVLESLQERGISIDAEKIDIVLPDRKDIVFYEVVMEKRKKDSAYLVTGNSKHFPKEPFVVTPREMVGILERDDG
ncbi:MAG: putative toxin-antitoxin system toxin component, PIN family [Roseburia sp.]|nr:putative toxin-antitoxin system toxin component, PIN family [Roseburia sp.]